MQAHSLLSNLDCSIKGFRLQPLRNAGCITKPVPIPVVWMVFRIICCSASFISMHSSVDDEAYPHADFGAYTGLQICFSMRWPLPSLTSRGLLKTFSPFVNGCRLSVCRLALYDSLWQAPRLVLRSFKIGKSIVLYENKSAPSPREWYLSTVLRDKTKNVISLITI